MYIYIQSIMIVQSDRICICSFVGSTDVLTLAFPLETFVLIMTISFTGIRIFMHLPFNHYSWIQNTSSPHHSRRKNNDEADNDASLVVSQNLKPHVKCMVMPPSGWWSAQGTRGCEFFYRLCSSIQPVWCRYGGTGSSIWRQTKCKYALFACSCTAFHTCMINLSIL